MNKNDLFYLRISFMATVSDLGKVVDNNLQIRNISGYFLFFCFWLVLFYFSLLLKPFFSIIIFSAVSAIALMPIHRRIVKVIHGPNLSSAISCVLFVFAIVIPLIALIFVLKEEMLSLYASIQTWLHPDALNATFQWAPGHFLYDLYQRIIVDVPLPSVNIADQIVGLVRGAGNFLIGQSQIILHGSLRFFFGFFVMLFALFYFLRDGEVIVAKITHFSLLPRRQELVLVEKTRSLVSIVFYGVLLSAVVQGVIGSIGFAIVGVQRPILLGMSVAFLSPIPYIGTALVWVPTVVLLYLAGDYGHALFLAIWCATIMSSIDAFFKPLFIGQQANIHPLLMFLSLFGGLAVYGPSGLILGPLIALLVVTFSEMYLASKHAIL